MNKGLLSSTSDLWWPWHHNIFSVNNYIWAVFDFQVAKEKFVKVDFKKFFVGNQSEHCPHDYVDINGER